MNLSNYKYNWLPKLAILCYCQFLFCQFFLESNIVYDYKYTQDNHTSLLIYLLSIIIAPPIIEEIIYRGLYQKDRINLFFAIVFLLGSTAILYFSNITLWWLFLIMTIIILYLVFRHKSKHSKPLLIIYSSIVFTVSHFSNTTSLLEIVQYSGNYLAGGLLLSWIAINFNLLKAILFHFAYNTITFIFFMFLTTPIEIKDTTTQQIEHQIKEVSILNTSNGMIERTENQFIAKNARITLILGYIKLPENKDIYLQSPMMKFNINIKDNLNNLDDKEILDILLKSNIIQCK